MQLFQTARIYLYNMQLHTNIFSFLNTLKYKQLVIFAQCFTLAMKQKLTIFGSIVAALFYVTVMLTFNSNCTIVQKTLSQKNTFIQYAENQISSQKDPSNVISEIVNLCKMPIKKLSNKLFTFPSSIIDVKPAEFAILTNPVKDSAWGLFSNIDIISPFNYFW